MKTEIRVSGLGGQGVIRCGMIIGMGASIYDGKHATVLQSFGPEARGSASSAQVTVSDAPIGYPYVKHADILILMSPDAYRQFAATLKPGGLLIYESELIKLDRPLPEGARAFGVPASRLAEELGRRIILNAVMVGVFAGLTSVVSSEALEKAVGESVPKTTRELNLTAYRRGLEYVRGAS